MNNLYVFLGLGDKGPISNVKKKLVFFSFFPTIPDFRGSVKGRIYIDIPRYLGAAWEKI